ncbi:MAG: TlpA family protein disulfide reductase [Nitriliruptoraceae bacterium]|nr:TlpA family protein disulfide reductase [Nitriliruptoraceae bacterium]
MPTSTTKPPLAQRSRRARDAHRRNLVVGAIVGIVVVALAVLIGWSAANSSSDRVALEDIVAEVSVTGEMWPALPQDLADDPAIGLPSPAIEGTTFDGDPIVVGEPGNPQVIALMASWCPACQQELPTITSWVADGGVPDDVDLVLVNVFSDPSRPNWPPTQWYEQEGYTGPVLADSADSEVAEAFGMGSVPSWIVLDDQGTAVFRVTGLLDRAQLDMLVEMARAGV